MSPFYLRKLKDYELDHALAIIFANLEWLENRGIRQWSSDLIRRAYPEYQKLGENYAFLSDDQVVSVLSVHKKIPWYWRDQVGTNDNRFLSKLAVDVSLRGQGIGRKVMKAVLEHLRGENVQDLFLEVSYGDGFLTKYYSEFGFTNVSRIEIELESGTYDMVLMKCNLVGN